jgi:hypothetical protein
LWQFALIIFIHRDEGKEAREKRASFHLAPRKPLWHREGGRKTNRPRPASHLIIFGAFFMRRSFILTATMLAALVGAAHAQDRVQVGVLECRGGASVGFVVGSVTNLGCVLRIEGMPEDRYIATIRKVGLDLGITQETALAWGVYAPVNRLGPGDLAGDYAGAQGSASVGVGAGGNMLVGGSNNTIALQPLSLQGQVGINVAAGLESLELRPGR